jgi:hypothetical protein
MNGDGCSVRNTRLHRLAFVGEMRERSFGLTPKEEGIRMQRRRVVLLLASFIVCVWVLPVGSSASPGFTTSEPRAAVPLAAGVRIRPILTAADVINGFQATGVFDGIGFYRSSPSTVEVFVDHELANKSRHVNATDNFDARVTHLTLTNRGRVLSGEYALDGNEGFIWFCSGNLTVLDGTPWFFTGEEDQDHFSPHHGTTIAIDASNPTSYRVLDHFGFFAHEQELPVTGLEDAAAFVLPEDNPGGILPGTTSTPNISQLYAYTAADWSGAIDGTGALRVWVPDRRFTDGNPSTNDIHKGQKLKGRFVQLDQATDNASPTALELAAQAKGAFDFVRLEDAAASQTQDGVVYFSDTGRAGRETVRGRVYKLKMDEKNPTRATLSIVLDGDTGDRIINPDNLETTKKSLVIQEDRNSEHRFPFGTTGSLLKRGESPFSLIRVYNFATGSIVTVARPDTPEELFATRGQGDWETSGLTDASALWGEGWFLFDVQMHHTSVLQPDSTLVPNTTTGESGQLARIYIPGT